MPCPFALAAWELPSGSPSVRATSLIVRVPAHFQGVAQILLARTLDFGEEFAVNLVRREEDTDADEANWTPLRASDAQMMPWPLYLPLEEWDDVIRESVYGRSVWWESTMGVLHPDGRGHWYTPELPEPVPFRWHDGTRDWMATPAREWKDKLEAELQDPESDASFAYRWGFLSDEQRRAVVWECEGGWDNFYNLLQWMMKAQPDLEQEQSYAIQVLCLNYGRDEFALEFWFEEWVNDGYVSKSVEWIVEWENLINELFSIRPRRELIERYSCARVEFSLDMAHGFLVERGPTSHHEKLEALLHLNEWSCARGVTMLTGELPRFDLEEWELEPFATEPREGVATVRVRANWLGEEREFWLRQVEMAPQWFVAFARSCDGSFPGNLVLCGNIEDDDQLATARSWKPTGLAPLWVDLAQYSLVGRLFCLDLSPWNQPGRATFTLRANGKGYLEWQPPFREQQYDDQAIFHWDAHGLGTASSLLWLERLEAELGEPTSDVSFTLRWLQLSDEQRASQIILCQRGCLSELRQVLEWAIRCDPAFAWDLSSPALSKLKWREWLWTAWPLERLVQLPEERDEAVSFHLKLWREAILNWFEPTLNEELKRAHPCVQSFCCQVKEQLFQFKVALQTPKKRADALRQLREWAQGKVPDELLAELL